MKLPFKHFLCQAKQRNQPGPQGTLVGDGLLDDKPVYLSASAEQGHTLLLGTGQTAKKTLLAHLAAAAMRRDSALIVIDTEGDLLSILSKHVTSERVQDVMWLDFANSDRVIGWNVLDAHWTNSSTAVFQSLAHTAETVQSKYWDAPTKETLQWVVDTFSAANRTLAEKGEPLFTLMDASSLVCLPTFRRRVLNNLIADPKLSAWWIQHYEAMAPVKEGRYLGGLLALLDGVKDPKAMANILGQSYSTFDLRDLLRPGNIGFINLYGLHFQRDWREWLGALLLDRINLMLLERRNRHHAQPPVPLTIAINGALPIPLLKSPGYLAELGKCGVRYILQTETLGYPGNEEFLESMEILRGLRNLFVFRTSDHDAHTISNELEHPALFFDLVRLREYECFLMTPMDQDDTVIQPIVTLPPLGSEHPISPELLKRKDQFSRPVKEVKSARQDFKQEWYYLEMTLIRKELASRRADLDTPPDERRDI